MKTEAQKIAERVPLPEPHESAVVCLTPEGYAHGNMLDVQLQVPQGTGMRRGDVLYTAAQMEALRLAVAAEALRGAEAVPRLPAHRERVSEIEDAVASGRMNAHQCFTQMRQLITAPPAGSVEVTESMVTGFLREYLCREPSEKGVVKLDDPVSREFARGLLTAALQEPEA